MKHKNITKRVKNNFGQIWGHLKYRNQYKYFKNKAFKTFCDLYQSGYTIPQIRNAINFCEDEKCNKIFESEIYKYLPQIKTNKIKNTSLEIIENKNADIIKINKDYNNIIKQLKTCNYKKYLKSSHWKHFRKEALKFFNNTCQKCGMIDKGLHIHHLTYKNRGRETFNDVIALCEKCHKKEHE